ncbi:MAG: hypothetical protein H6733_12470 [Alphaproteobacteria bacterium]|nr:hypothetical protein [Alphaproteobacteria bacterium]
MPGLPLVLALATVPAFASEAPSSPDPAPPTVAKAPPSVLPDDDALAASTRRLLERRKRTNTVGMSVLLGWSLGNVAVGAGGWALASDPEWVAFHQMSIAWNGVNLALAIPGLVGALRDDPSSYDLRRTLRATAADRVTFALNTGLDVGWMASGAFLWERGLRTDDPRLIGFGRSMVLQGGFLLLFDLTMTLVHTTDARRWMVSPLLGDRLGLQVAGTW